MSDNVDPTEEEALPAHGPGAAPLGDAATATPSAFSVGQQTLARDDADILQQPASGPRFMARRLLGRGGMGEVWLAEDLDLGREVAVKTLRKQNSSAVLRFVREARLNGQLEHPNIVPVHDLLVERGRRAMPYIVMKRVRGVNFAALLRSLGAGEVVPWFGDGSSEVQSASQFPGEQASDPAGRALRLGEDPRGDLSRLLGVFLKICDGIAYAHARGVIHRDLKPSNIMLGEFGEVLVMDWGLAKRLGEDEQPNPQYRQASESTETVDGVVIGTPAYMAPEQARGENAAVDRRADIYALGALLYQILTLRMPYEGPRETLLTRVACGVLDPPSQRAPERWIPAELEGIVLKAMAAHPEERYARVQDLAEDVQRLLAGRLVLAHSYSPWQRVRKWAARHKKVVTWVALLAALLGGAAFAVLDADRRVRQRVAQSAADELARHVGQARAQLETWQARVDALAGAVPGAGVVEDCRRLAPAIADSLAPLIQDDRLRNQAQELVAWAVDLPARVAAVRERSLQRWARRELDQLLAAPEGEAAEAAFERFVPFLAEGVPRPALPVADFALLAARMALEKGEQARAFHWVAQGYAAQPRSGAAGQSFLMLAERSLSEGEYRQASSQFLLALQAFAEHPQLRPRAWLGLAEALTGLPADAAPPFDPDQQARRLALRCLLEVMQPDATLRFEAAALQDPGFVRRAQQLRAVLTRATVSALAADWAGWRILPWEGAPAGMIARLRGARLELLRQLPPEKAGGGPARWQLVQGRDFGGLLREVDPASGGVFGEFVQLCALEPGKQGLLWLASDGRQLLGVRSLEIAAARVSIELPARLFRLCVGDFDGDGQVDLISAHYLIEESVFLIFGRADGGFTQPRALARSFNQNLTTMQELLGRMGPSVPYGLELADLDGDGALELAVGYGEWSQYALHIYRARDDQSVAVVDHRWLGRTALGLVPDGRGGQLLLTRNSLEEGDWAAFHENGWPQQPELPRLWSLSHSQLRGLQPPDGDLPADVTTVGAGGFAASGQHALVLWGDARSYVRFHPAPSWESPLLGQLQCGGAGLLPREDGLTLAFPASRGPLHRPEPHGVFRLAGTEDLAEIAREALRLPQAPPVGSEELAGVRFLEQFGLPADAARSARQVRERGGHPWEVEHALLRAEIHGLRAAGSEAALIQLLAEMRPQPGLVAECIAAIEMVARRRWDAGIARRVLQRWLAAVEPELPEAELLRTRLAVWSEDSALPQVAWQGQQLETAGEAQNLETLLMAGDAWTLLPGPEGESWQLQGRQQARWAARGEDLEPRPGDGFAGLPLELEGDAWRMQVDLRIAEAPWGSELFIGLLPLVPMSLGAAPRPVAGLNLRMRGGNQVDRIELHAVQAETWLAGPLLDTLAGRWLRIEVAYLPALGELRLSVSDRDAAELVFARETRCEPLPGRHFLLGFAPGASEEPLRAEVGRLALFTSARLMSDRHPLVDSVFRRLPHVRAYSHSARARLRGRAAEAGQALQPVLAALYETSGEALPDRVAQQAAFVAFDQAWLASAGEEQAFVASLAAVLEAGARWPWLVAWQQQVGGAALPAAFWSGVGRVLASQVAPGLSEAELAGAIEARIAAGDWRPEDLALLAWLEQTSAAQGLEAHWLAQTFLRSQDYRLVRFAGQRLIRHFDSSPGGVSKASGNVRLAVGLALFGNGRREEMLQLFVGLKLPAGLELPVDLQRFVQRRRLEEFEAGRAEAGQRSLRMPGSGAAPP